jgi:hypothetical protein
MYNSYAPYNGNYVPYNPYNYNVVQQNNNPVFQNSNPNTQRIDFTGALVNNFNEVKDYAVSIGGMALLLNKSDKTFYLKSLNENGIPIIETYKFDNCTEDNSKEASNKIDIVDIDKRLKAIENKINSVNPYESL